MFFSNFTALGLFEKNGLAEFLFLYKKGEVWSLCSLLIKQFLPQHPIFGLPDCPIRMNLKEINKDKKEPEVINNLRNNVIHYVVSLGSI